MYAGMMEVTRLAKSLAEAQEQLMRKIPHPYFFLAAFLDSGKDGGAERQFSGDPLDGWRVASHGTLPGRNAHPWGSIYTTTLF